MSNELTINASLAYSDSEGTEDSREVVNLLDSVANKRIAAIKQSVGTTEVAINLGGISAPGWCMFINRDPTNFIYLRVGTGGSRFAKVRAGMPALFYLGPDAQVPYAIADTAACQLETLIIST